jgi:hypothetical protein
LIAEPLLYLESQKGKKVGFAFKGARVTHPGKNDKRDFYVTPNRKLFEVSSLDKIKELLIAERNYKKK